MKYIKMVLAIIFFVTLDQTSKYLIVTNFRLGERLEIIKGVFELTYVKNTGAVWGILPGKQSFFLVMTCIAIILLVYLYIKLPIDKKYTPIKILSLLIISGAIGNSIDRFANGFVIDFLYFSLIDFPVFNIADCYITVSEILLILLVLFRYKEKDFDFLFSKKVSKSGEQNDD